MSQVVLFDLDGTIADTERVAIEVIGKYFTRQGHRVPAEHLEYIVGRPWITGVEYLLARYPLGQEPTAVEAEVLSAYREELQRGVPPITGSVEAIRSFAKQYRLGVVSGSRREEIEIILTAMGVCPLFEHLVGFDDYRKAKPDPEPYHNALERFGVEPGNALVFEDSDSGVRAAQAAGLLVVGVGSGSQAARTRPPTPWTIPDFTGIDAAWVTRCLAPKVLSTFDAPCG